MERLFKVSDFLQASDDEPIRSVVTESADAAIIAWYVRPGQRIAAHVHPEGQDSWTILSGHGQYQTDHDGAWRSIGPGTVLVAPRGAVHGVYNDGSEPLIFVSVVSPAAAGYERLPAQVAHSAGA